VSEASDQTSGRDEATPPTRTNTSARWVHRALYLVAATALYNAIEAVVAIVSGILAASIALVAFGLDSVIELAAAGVVLWRLRLELLAHGDGRAEAGERRVLRLVGWTFLALAVYVLIVAGWTLWKREEPRESIVGIVLALFSLIVMPLIAWAKLRAARALRSRSLRAEALETLACAWLSLALLLGLVANAALGWWWADPLAALAMVPWLAREGREALNPD
jgi:divalent metal cation (Fe/Co/Zn/Cd) transporter